MRKNKNIVLSIWYHLTKRRKKQIFLLLFLTFLNGIFEIFTLISLIPFLSALSNPEKLFDYQLIKFLSRSIGLFDASSLIISITIFFILTILITTISRLSNIWLNSKLSAFIGSELATKAYSNILYQPYTMHVEQNSSNAISSITNYTGSAVKSINLTLNAINSTIITISLIFGLLIVDSKIALISLFTFAIIYISLSILI